MNVTLGYLKDRYTEEQSRFDHFENKCSKLLTFITAIIGAITAFASMKSGAIFALSSPLSYVIFTIFLFSSFSICCAWGHALLALRVGDCPALPRSRQNADYLACVDTDTQSAHLFNCYMDTLEKLSVAISQKSKNIEHSYNELTYSAWGMVLIAAITIYMETSK